MYTLEEIIEILDRHHQRATYEAVAGLVGATARSVMSGEIKRAKNSWVVARQTGLPTGYKSPEIHSALKERSKILDSAKSLSDWLRKPE